MYGACGVNRLVAVIGYGFPPGKPAQGLSKPPAGLFFLISSPNGGATVVLNQSWLGAKSKNKPYDARIEVLPLPVGSQARPTRGSKSFHFLYWPDLPEKPGSPAKYSPGGAFGYTWLTIPWL